MWLRSVDGSVAPCVPFRRAVTRTPAVEHPWTLHRRAGPARRLRRPIATASHPEPDEGPRADQDEQGSHDDQAGGDLAEDRHRGANVRVDVDARGAIGIHDDD